MTPRISGTWTQVLHVRSFPIDPGRTVGPRLDGGRAHRERSWRLVQGGIDGYGGDNGGREFYRLDGEGAYEGLTAVLRWVAEGDAYEGVIVPGVPPEYRDHRGCRTRRETADEEPTA